MAQKKVDILPNGYLGSVDLNEGDTYLEVDDSGYIVRKTTTPSSTTTTTTTTTTGTTTTSTTTTTTTEVGTTTTTTTTTSTTTTTTTLAPLGDVVKFGNYSYINGYLDSNGTYSSQINPQSYLPNSRDVKQFVYNVNNDTTTPKVNYQVVRKIGNPTTINFPAKSNQAYLRFGFFVNDASQSSAYDSGWSLVHADDSATANDATKKFPMNYTTHRAVFFVVYDNASTSYIHANDPDIIVHAMNRVSATEMSIYLSPVCSIGTTAQKEFKYGIALDINNPNISRLNVFYNRVTDPEGQFTFLGTIVYGSPISL